MTSPVATLARFKFRVQVSIRDDVLVTVTAPNVGDAYEIVRRENPPGAKIWAVHAKYKLPIPYGVIRARAFARK